MRDPRKFKWFVGWSGHYDAATISVLDSVDGFYCWIHIPWPHFNNPDYVKLSIEELQLALMFDVK